MPDSGTITKYFALAFRLPDSSTPMSKERRTYLVRIVEKPLASGVIFEGTPRAG